MFVDIHAFCKNNNLSVDNCFGIGDEVEDLTAVTKKMLENRETISFFDGLSLADEYLSQFGLDKRFQEMIDNGQVNIGFDEDIEQNFIDEEESYDYRANLYYFKDVTKVQNFYENDNEFDVDKKIYDDYVSITSFPSNEIYLYNDKTTYSFFASWIHEFMHTVFAYGKDGVYDFKIYEYFSEFISIYFEFDFISFLISKGVDYKNFDHDLFRRYSDAIGMSLDVQHLDFTSFLKEKMEKGVFDMKEYSNLDESNIDEILKKIKDDESSEKFVQEYCKYNSYVYGGLIAYYLHKHGDTDVVSKNLIGMINRIDEETTESFLGKLGLSQEQLCKMDYQTILLEMKEDIAKIHSRKYH